MSDEPTIDERMAAVKSYLRERLFGLAAVVRNPRSDNEQFPHASGVLLEIQGFFVLVTVAHFLEDVRRWEEENRLEQLSLIVHHETGLPTAIELDLSKVGRSNHEEVDIGFMILPPDVLERVIKHGGRATHKEKIDLPSDRLTRYYLIGLAAKYSPIRQETISTVGETRWVLTSVGNPPIALSSLRFLGDGDSRYTYRFAPHQGLLSYSGCSGGPVFGYAEGMQIRDYRFVGIQSYQILDTTPEEKPKELVVSSAAYAVLAINAYLEHEFGPIEGEPDSGDTEPVK